MAEVKLQNHKESENVTYKLVAPDGGYGYVVMMVVTLTMIFYFLPLVSFGLVYGNFLSSVGSETTGTTLANGMFNTVSSFMGLIASALLNMYSYRKVSFAGGLIFAIGATGVIFCNDLITFIIFWGVLQGIGYGIFMPAAYSAFNSYFDKKLALAMSVSQAIMIAAYMLASPLANYSMRYLGYRGTLTVAAVFTCVNLPFILLFHPVKKHMKKIPVDVSMNDTAISVDLNNKEKTKSLGEDTLKSQIEPLLNKLNIEHTIIHTSHKSLNQKNITHISRRSLHGSQVILPKPRMSIISIGDRVASVNTVHDFDEEENMPREGFWKTLVDSFDFSLLKSLRYLNLSTGLALSFTADMLFFPLIPLILKNIGFNTDQQTVMMTAYFAADLLSRILLSIASGIVRFRSRYLVFGGTILSAVFRYAWVSYDTYTWKISVLAILGFLRCFIQTPLPLTISEECPDQFSTAYSLFMVINGAVSLASAPLMSVIKKVTESDVIVCHILTVMFLICTASWLVEFLFFEKRKSNKNECVGDITSK